MLAEEQVQSLHDLAMRVLAELGVAVEHPALRERLAGSGCRIAGERVFMPPDVVSAALQHIPVSFTLFGRLPESPLVIGLARTYGTNTGIFPNIYDFESGRIRRSTLEDVKATTRLLDAMDNVHVEYVSLVDATEVQPHMVTVSDFAAVLANTTKPLIGPGLANRAEAEAVVALAQVVRQGHDMLRRFPLCVPFVCLVSPLRLPKDIADALIVIAEAGLPLDVLSNPVMGVSAPYSVAGTVALGHAEVLAMAVMAQVITPGLPILSQNTPSVADMRTMASTTGGPETGLARQAAMLVSRHLGIPCCAHGHTSSAAPDWQAAEEKSLNGLLIASARPSLLGGMGALANVTLTSYETIVLDNERYGAILRILDGVEVDEEHLAFDVMVELAQTGAMMEHPHTLKYLRSPEVWKPRLAQRQGLVGGMSPSETSLDRARAEAKRLLDTYEVEPLAPSMQQEIDEILRGYDTRFKTGRPG